MSVEKEARAVGSGVTSVDKSSRRDMEELSSWGRVWPKCPEVCVAVGFGISSRDSVSDIAKTDADGVVIGSSLIKVMEEATVKKGSPIQLVKDRLEDFGKGLSEKR